MEQEQNFHEVTFRDYLRVIFRYKAVVITSFLTVVITVFLGLKLKTKEYESSVKLLISAEKQVESPYYKELLGYRNTEIALTQSEIVKSDTIINRVVQALKLYEKPLDYEKQFTNRINRFLITLRVNSIKKKLKKFSEPQQKAFMFRMAAEELKNNISVEPIRDTNLFKIAVKDFSPVGAAVTANVISRAYLIFDLEQQLVQLQLQYGEKHPMVMQLKESIKKVSESLSGQPISDMDALGPASVKIVEQAEIPLKPVGPSKVLVFLLAFIMAPFLGIMLAFIFEYTDRTFKSPADIERFLNIPYLGSVPKNDILDQENIKDIRQIKLHTDSYQTLADQIYLLIKNKKLKTLMASAVLPKEGTSTFISSLGLYFAHKLDKKVLIIDANLRNSSIFSIFDLPREGGLADVLEGKTTISRVVRNIDDNLHVIQQE